VQAESPENESLEMAGQKIGDKKASGFVGHQFVEVLGTSENLIAVGTTDSLDPLLLNHGSQSTACAAIAVQHQDFIVRLPTLVDFGANFLRYSIGIIM